MKRIPALTACALLIMALKTAYAVYPVASWEQLIATTNRPTPPALPVLTNTFGTEGTETTYSFDAGDGLATMVTINALHRWDDARLLLGIRENGIVESPDLQATNETLYALSTNYPDRSLIWIDAANGQPLGLALHIGLQPVTLEQEFIDGALINGDADYLNQDYFSFAVSDDGWIYTGYKNKLLRYGSDGLGGINPVPQVCAVLTTNNASWPANPNINTGPYGHFGSFPKIHVRGSGTNTVIVAGGMGIGRGWRFSTPDGTNFVAGSSAGGGQGGVFSSSFSMLATAVTNENSAAGEEWMYGTWYPENNGGAAIAFRRYAVNAPYENANPNIYQQTTNPPFLTQGAAPAGLVTAYSPYSTDPALQKHAYNANFIGGLQTRGDLEYMVAYSAPPWNSITRYATSLDPYWQTSWLALHDRSTGARLGTLPIDVRESDALFTDNIRMHWYAIYGNIALNKLNNGEVEILVANPVFGYGRYLVKSEVINVTNWVHAAGTVTVNFTAECSANTRFQLQRSSDLSPGSWINVGDPAEYPAGTLVDPGAFGDAAFYRVQLSYF